MTLRKLIRTPHPPPNSDGKLPEMMLTCLHRCMQEAAAELPFTLPMAPGGFSFSSIFNVWQLKAIKRPERRNGGRNGRRAGLQTDRWENNASIQPLLSVFPDIFNKIAPDGEQSMHATTLFWANPSCLVFIHSRSRC